MSEENPFIIEKRGKIAWLILNNPKKRNAMGLAFFSDIVKHFEDFDSDPEIRVVVIKGAGGCFTAGIDLAGLASLITDGGADTREKLRKTILKGQEAASCIEKCTKPVIAAVHSHCVGGGVDLISACDIRIASKDAKFSIRETKLAVIADVGTLQRLPHIIGHGWFRELALTGRDFTAEEALKMGFITRICEDQEALFLEAENLAAEIAGLAPLAVQGTKDVLMYSRDNGIYAGLQYVAQKNAAALISEDAMEAIGAFIEKRDPVYKGK
jgi:Delta3,5-Delta2,4-dienoyl-CoA isomerase